jgi:hypothetical protein
VVDIVVGPAWHVDRPRRQLSDCDGFGLCVVSLVFVAYSGSRATVSTGWSSQCVSRNGDRSSAMSAERVPAVMLVLRQSESRGRQAGSRCRWARCVCCESSPLQIGLEQNLRFASRLSEYNLTWDSVRLTVFLFLMNDRIEIQRKVSNFFV